MAYFVPNKFSEEATVLQGRIKVRSLIEMVAFSLLPAMLALKWGTGLQGRIFLIIVLAGPIAILSYIGIGGDYLSVALLNILRWLTKKSQKLYDMKPRLYIVSPADAAFAQSDEKGDLMEAINKIQKERLEKKTKEHLVEGKDFVFEENPYEEKYQSDNMLKVKKKIEQQKAENTDLFSAEIIPDDLFGEEDS